VLSCRGWSKDAEDQIDALICALVGLHHWRHLGERSEILGDAATGFIVAPAAIDPRCHNLGYSLTVPITHSVTCTREERSSSFLERRLPKYSVPA